MIGNRVLILASVASMIDQFNMPNIKLLKEMGYEVHVACNFIEGNTCSYEKIENLKNNLSDLNIKYHQIDFKRNVMRLVDNVKAYKQVYKLACNNNFVFIHCHSPIGGVVGRLVGKKTNTKVIYTAHGFHFYKGAPLKNWLVYYPIEKWLSGYTDVLITINKEDYNRAKRKFKANRIEYIPGVGIDIEKFKNINVLKQEKRNSIGINEDEFMVISVGELNKNKNHQVIIRAISSLKNEKIKYVLCGEGPLEIELKDLANKLGVKHQVKFLGFRNDIPELMKVADLFAFPSFREGLSLSLMEAMASGLPVICSKIRGNSDLITNEQGGYMFKPQNIDGIVTGIRNLINSNLVKSEFSSYNINKITEYSIDKVLKEYDSIYKTLE